MNPQKENTMLEETPIKETSKRGRRAKKAESSEESAEEQDDVMDLDEEEEMALRFRRNSCMHGARRKSLDGLPPGQWSRRSSLVGKEFLSKDDEMATVMRFGTTMQIPRRLSHHVPRVPILETDNYVDKTPWRWFHIDMDEFQLYKLAHLEVYSITEVAKMEIVGDPNGSNLNRFSLANMKGHKLFQDGQALTEEELMEILKSSLGSKSLDDMDRLLTKDKMNDKDVIDQCRQFGKTQEDEDAAALEQLKNGMTAEELQELEKLLAGGMTIQEALAFLKAKKEKEEEERMRKEIEEAQRLFEEAKLRGDAVMEMEDGGKLIKEKLKETFETQDGVIEIDNDLLMDLEDRYSKLKSSSLNEVELEKEAISIVAALLNYTDLNYHIMLSMVISAKVNLKFFLNFPTVQDLIKYIVN